MKSKKKIAIFSAVAAVIVVAAVIAALVFLRPQWFRNDGELYTYTYSDGTVVEYYMDEDGHPYNYKDGEKIFISLPLDQFVVTGEAGEEYKDEIHSIEDEISAEEK